MDRILHARLQKRLDLLDEEIDALERDKDQAGDDNLPRDLEEAKEIRQIARDDYGGGFFLKALFEVHRAEWYLFFGSQRLTTHNVLLDELGKALVGKD